MLSVSNVSYSYSRRGTNVLEDFSMKLDRPGIYGLLGPNGAGKSTLLYLIMGALTPKSGNITLDDNDVRRRLPSVLANIVLVPEELDLPKMSLDCFVRHYGAMYTNFSQEVMADCMKEFDMPDNVNLTALSMGQKKKVYISYALACNTPYLLMDEPTNGLDIQAKAAFRRLMARYTTEDRRVIISTHQVRDLEQLLDHILIMNHRKVLLDSTVANLQERLTFGRNESPETAADALFSIPSPGGVDTIRKNLSGQFTDVNLEILFEFALKNSDALDAILEEVNAPSFPGTHFSQTSNFSVTPENN